MVCADAPVMPMPKDPAIAIPTSESMHDLAVMFCSSFTACYGFKRTITVQCRSNRPLFFELGGLVATALRAGTGQDVVAVVQRAVARSKPLGAKCRAASPAVIDRQLQSLEQGLDLTACDEVARIRVDAGHGLARFVQRSKAAREAIPIDLSFMETQSNSEPEPECQFVQAFAHNRFDR